MKWLVGLVLLGSFNSLYAQVWKTLPKGVRIAGYRNVTTNKVKSTFQNDGSENRVSTQVKLDGPALGSMSGNVIKPGENISQEAYEAFRAGHYQVDGSAQFNVHGMGFGYGITDKIMIYGEIAYFQARVNASLKRTAGNTYEQTARIEERNGGSYGTTVAENLRQLPDLTEQHIQSYITSLGYKPLGNWQGNGYGDMETGLMIKILDRGYTGLMLYPGLILPTGTTDDPDILQDVGFGDGQYDAFLEMGTGYVFNDGFNLGTTLRYTYQAPGKMTLRVPTSQDNTLSDRKDNFIVKYGDKLNWMLNSTFRFNDWIAFTPLYRLMYQGPSQYDSHHDQANTWLSRNTEKVEHQLQLTTTLSSITPFLKKQFMVPAQINLNAVQTVAGRNVPKAGRFELEFRMLF